MMWFWWLFGAVVISGILSQPKMTEAEFQRAKAETFREQRWITEVEYEEWLAEYPLIILETAFDEGEEE